MKGITIFYIFQNLRNNNLIDKDINFLLFIYIYRKKKRKKNLNSFFKILIKIFLSSYHRIISYNKLFFDSRRMEDFIRL